MHQIWRRHAWLRPLFMMLAWADILFPETGRDVPASMTIEPDGHGGDVWQRTFAFARERRFNATMVYRGSSVIERLGPHGMLDGAVASSSPLGGHDPDHDGRDLPAHRLASAALSALAPLQGGCPSAR
jgi:hypothetical protein